MEFSEVWPDTCSSLGVLARLGNFSELEKLLRQGRPCDVKDNRGWQPIHEAAANGHYDCLDILINHAPEDCQNTTYEGDTPLILACNFGHPDVIKLLIQRGADPNKCRPDQHTPLLSAVKSGSIDCVQTLIEANANVTFQYFNGWAPLHEAACQGLADIAQILIRSGASLKVRDDFGITPLFTAAQYGRIECLKTLIEAAAVQGLNDLVNTPADDGATPLFIASQENYMDCVELLLSCQANPNKGTNDGILPIHVASQIGNVRCVDVLLKHTDIGELKKNSLSPLFLAIDWQHYDVLQRLITSGLPLNPICQSYAENYRTTVKLPIIYGRYMTPLVRAIFNLDLKATEMLLAAGVSPQPQNEIELPAIIPAIDKGDKSFVEVLVRYGLDINWKSSDHLVCPDVIYLSLHKPDIMDLLLRSGLNAGKCFDCDCHKQVQYRISICKALPLYKNKFHIGIAIEKLLQFSSNVSLCSKSLHYLSQETNWQRLRDLIENPHSLMHLCRLNILKSINHRLREKLPTILQDYLKFCDL